MKEQIRTFWNKIVEKKDILIPIGTGIAGALIGAGVTAVIYNQMGVQPVITMEDIVTAAEKPIA